jgi:hypothetical protein
MLPRGGEAVLRVLQTTDETDASFRDSPMRANRPGAIMPTMSDEEFTFVPGQRVRANDGREGVVEHLGRISNEPAYFVKTAHGGRWYVQSELSPAE